MSETKNFSAEEAAELVVHCFVRITKTAEMLLDLQDQSGTYARVIDGDNEGNNDYRHARGYKYPTRACRQVC